MPVTQRYKLNIVPEGTPVVVHASQYDAQSRDFYFTIYNGSELFEIPSGSSVTVRGTKPDNTGFEYSATYNGSLVHVIVEAQMTVLPGNVRSEIRITNGAQILGTANFILRVESAGLSDDTQISETELPLIEKAAAAGALASQVGNNTSAINTLSARMDEFTRLPDGSTTGDAELADGRITYQGRTMTNIGDAIRLQASQSYKYGAFNILDNINKSNRTTAGLTYTWNADGTCRVSGTASGATICNIVNGALPSNMKAGAKYKVKYASVNVILRIASDSAGGATVYYEGTSDGEFTLPDNATTLLIRLRTMTTSAIDETVYPQILNAETNEKLTIKYDNFNKSINLDSQVSTFTTQPVQIEKGATSIYIQLWNLFFRGRYHRHYTNTTMADAIQLVTSPNGLEHCIEIPFNKSLIYHIDTEEFEIVDESTPFGSQSYSGLNTINLAYITSDGKLVGGKLFEIYIHQQDNNTDAIPQYFVNQLDSKLPLINANMSAGRNAFTFIHVTDTHVTKSANISPILISYLLKNTRIPQMVHNGDIIGTYTDSQESALSTLREALSQFNLNGKNMYVNFGNHDYNWVNNHNDHPERVLNQDQMYGVMMADMKDMTFYQTGKYHYIHIDENTDTALICLQTKWNYANNDGAFDSADIQPLTNLLDSLTVNNIIITAHMIFSQASGSSEYTNLNNLNYQRIRQAIDASSNASKVKAIITGHNHLDYSVIDNGLLIVSTTTDSLIGNESAVGSVNECAFDIMTFDYSANKLKCVRIGRGNDRNIDL